jgi:hypothetical protein
MHCLVRGPPYVRIPKVARQVMEVLAAQVAVKFVGKRLDLFDLPFAKCKRHWFSSCASLSVFTKIDQCVCGKKFLPVCGAQDEML